MAVQGRTQIRCLFLERVGNSVILRVFCEFDCGLDAASMMGGGHLRLGVGSQFF
jgi:hypothetical protein